MVFVVVLVLVGEGAHGARLRADGGVVAAPPAPALLPRVLSPPVYGFSDPPRYQGSLVLRSHLSDERVNRQCTVTAQELSSKSQYKAAIY
uniref:Uncharacterized protein n=1 Tax=Arundo donax TaxID=35708 RepID=A0A0A9ET97_ARUDO